jgi:hypothetical protein
MTLKSYQAQAQPGTEPLYDIEWRSGATIEVFYANATPARSFGAHGPGWFWWTCQAGCIPSRPAGPFTTKYLAFREAIADDFSRATFGLRKRCA